MLPCRDIKRENGTGSILCKEERGSDLKIEILPGIDK
jgi:hypothetical protein